MDYSDASEQNSRRLKIMRRNSSIHWAREIVANKEQYVIIDTETTGLKDNDLVIHLGLMDLNRTMLVDTLVKPTSKRRIAKEAEYIHGITLKDLKDAPLFNKVVDDMRPLVEGKKFLCFNWGFHYDKLSTTFENEGGAGDNPFWFSYGEDVQEIYNAFSGYHRSALPGRNNTGDGDCNAVLDLIEMMAETETQEVPVELPTIAESKSKNELTSNYILNGVVLMLAFFGFISAFTGHPFLALILFAMVALILLWK